jgi:hypothetical protein
MVSLPGLMTRYRENLFSTEDEVGVSSDTIGRLLAVGTDDAIIPF